MSRVPRIKVLAGLFVLIHYSIFDGDDIITAEESKKSKLIHELKKPISLIRDSLRDAA
jgi:hypothetical protein